MVFLFRLFGLIALVIPFFFGYHLFYGDWESEGDWNLLAGVALFFSILFALVGLAITKSWLSKN